MTTTAGSSSSLAKILDQKLFGFGKKRNLDHRFFADLQQLDPEATALLHRLLEREQKLDAKLLKKQLDIQEASFKTFKSRKRMKIFITCSWCRQTAGYAWTLRIDGRVFDLYRPNSPTSNRKFSSFLKSIHIELDPLQYPSTDGFIEWTKIPLAAGEFDGFEIKRTVPQVSESAISIPIKIFLTLDYGCDKFKLSPRLSDLLAGKTIESKPQIIMGIWQYVKLHKLQNVEDKRMIDCDDLLVSLFNQTRVSFAQIPHLITKHLSPVEPVELAYTLSIPPATDSGGEIDEAISEKALVWEVEFDCEDATRGRAPTLLTGAASTKEISLLEQKIADVQMMLQKSVVRRQFLERFVDDPVQFINEWIVKQGRDLADVMDGAAGGGSVFEQSSWVQSIIQHYLQQHQQDE